MKILLVAIGALWLGYSFYSAHFYVDINYIAIVLPLSYVTVLVLLLGK